MRMVGVSVALVLVGCVAPNPFLMTTVDGNRELGGDGNLDAGGKGDVDAGGHLAGSDGGGSKDAGGGKDGGSVDGAPVIVPTGPVRCQARDCGPDGAGGSCGDCNPGFASCDTQLGLCVPNA